MILVTGGSGLVGKELIKQLLAKGKRVRAIYHKTPIKDFTDPNLEIVQADILDVCVLEDVLDGIDELYHCAGFISYVPGHTAKLYKINVEGTANVVNAALNAGVKKMLHVSSISAIGRPPDQAKLIDENMHWEETGRKSNYGQSKYLGELEVWRGVAEGLNAVVVNPSLILGVGNWNEGSTEIFKSVYKEFPWYTEGATGFVDVRDVAKAMIELMESGISSERFIVSGRNESFKNVFEMIAKAFNKKIPNRRVTPLLASIIWRLDTIKSKLTGKPPLITKETASSAMATQLFDNEKLKKHLPSFNYFPLEETIKYTCSGLQQKLNNQ